MIKDVINNKPAREGEGSGYSEKVVCCGTVDRLGVQFSGLGAGQCTGPGAVHELPDGVGNPAPGGRAVVIAVRCELAMGKEFRDYD